MLSSRRSRAVAVVAAGLLLAGVAWAAPIGVIGPNTGIQPTGRKLDPVGKLTQLGNFPTGGALTTDGRFLWTLSTGRSRNDIRIVRVAPRHGNGNAGVGDIVQTIPMPGLSGGIAMAPDGHTAYVSGLADSPHKDQQTPPSVPGRGGDVIHVFTYDPESGIAQRGGVIPVPPPTGTLPYQTFPPGSATESWPRDLAVSPNGKTLLAALNLADAAAVIDTATRTVRYVSVGHYPYGAAVTGDGRFGLVTSETEGTVSVINLASASVTKTIQVGPHLSHPEGMAVDPKSPLAFVANANQDVIAVIDTDTMTVQRTLSLARPQGTGTTPTYVSVTPDGCDLLSADSGEDAVAVFALSDADRCDGSPSQGRGNGSQPQRQPFELIGRLPVGSYPTMAAANSLGQLAWISARGLGVGPNPNGPNPNSPNDSDDFINSFQYLPSIVRGDSGILDFPSDRTIRRLTPDVDRQIVPTDSESPPAGTPIRPGGPIKHVFYVVRENRTYDQVLGDDPRGDGDPNLTVFGEHVTPNLHALAQRFPLLDHVYANSEASIDGHYWTAAGAVSDYVVKNWPQNYAGRGRPYDFGAYEVSKPPNDYLFHRALHEGVSFYNYGEALAGVSPFPDKDRTPEATAENLQVLDGSRSDIQIVGGCYDSDVAIFTSFGSSIDVYDSSPPPGAAPGSHSRFDCFKSRFQAQLAGNSVPAFNYMVLPLNHTQGVLPGARTPDADVASNDWGLGQIVDLISHSSIWNSSLILVVEDDSQDGADHVDAHRIPALVISPYTQRGAVVHDRYDQLSFLRTLEIIVGLRPLHLAEALAVPLYKAITPNPGNNAPYSAIMPSVNMTATNPATPANVRASAGLPLNAVDQVPQRQLDGILWQYRHGAGSTPPPPGPNASAADSGGRDESGDKALGQPSAFAQQLKHLQHKRQHHRHTAHRG
ncbi:MAG TPA: alkaline phosphatase family protein [Solirubrobacterales bacterium]